jgi:hypothetical protein
VGDRQRKRGFAGAALALLAMAVLLTLREPSAGPRSNARSGTTAIRTGVPPGSATAKAQTHGTVSPSPAEPSMSSSASVTPKEREAKDAPALAPGRATAAAGAARVFLDGYLRYSYGQSRASRIRAAAEQLLRELKRAPPHVPAGVARAHPRLISVRAEADLGDRAIDVLAVVDDGQRRYRVPLELRETGGAWVVTSIGG